MAEPYETKNGRIVVETKIEKHEDIVKLCHTLMTLIREKKTIIAIILAK